VTWEQDEGWGKVVWLTLVTGLRRGEMLALVWDALGLLAGVLTIRWNLVSHNGQTIVKDAKTRQMRRMSLDNATVGILDAHRKRCAKRCAAHLIASRLPQPPLLE
jgi:integrase